MPSLSMNPNTGASMITYRGLAGAQVPPLVEGVYSIPDVVIESVSIRPGEADTWDSVINILSFPTLVADIIATLQTFNALEE